VSTAAWANSSISVHMIDDIVGQWARREPERRLGGATPAAAPLCATTQPATFADEFASLAPVIVNEIGQPLACVHVDAARGDVPQATSTCVAIYRAGSHVAIFTDGYRHWLSTDSA